MTPTPRSKFMIESFLDIFATHHDPHYSPTNRDGHSPTEWATARQKRLNSDSTPTKRTIEPSPSLGQPSGSSNSHTNSRLTKTPGHGMWRQSGPSSGRGKREEPEWYIKKFMDRSADHRVVAALAVALRTYEITQVPQKNHSIPPTRIHIF
ncbi:hypothetical protein PGT21_024676 [Puccinia graminis f. sp. tritici]|uniref:Uncharacterized protein n=1 Tax=Puccinia graminis f. sp. tritici TaxID=56615 RepID=A0A5B0SJ04_PUCGR|nr:hypothetical protein PGT21_024676 [Puccinia graminis f. sp. tritici]KAA1137921.1 hypothetical protein PGTUg99_005680 [Puccinia graminis f. sp. tritici]